MRQNALFCKIRDNYLKSCYIGIRDSSPEPPCTVGGQPFIARMYVLRASTVKTLKVRGGMPMENKMKGTLNVRDYL